MTNTIKKHTRKTLYILCAMSVLFPSALHGNVVKEHEPARNMVWKGKIERHIAFLADSICQGRATGTRGGTEAAFHVLKQFRKAGLIPFDSTFVKHFYAGKGTVGHNIIGMHPGSKKKPCEKYVIVGAHYDHLGNLEGNFYPGADANASGTVALTCLADMFSAMKTIGKSYGSNIIFAAFDAKEMNMAGSEALWKMIENGELNDPLSGKPVTPDKISLMVNIDQIGCTLSPIQKGREDYMIMLGTHTLPREKRDVLMLCNRMYSIDMHIGLDYYGSDSFTRIFYGLSDQKVFADHGIPAVMFTSGITMNTNRTRDTADTLSPEIMTKRIWLIYHWLTKML